MFHLGNDPLGLCPEVVGQFLGGCKHGVPPRLDIVDAELHGLTQRLQLRRMVGLALLHEAQAVAQYFAGVLVPAAFDQALHERGLVVGDDDVAGGHGHAPVG